MDVALGFTFVVYGKLKDIASLRARRSLLLITHVPHPVFANSLFQRIFLEHQILDVSSFQAFDSYPLESVETGDHRYNAEDGQEEIDVLEVPIDVIIVKIKSNRYLPELSDSLTCAKQLNLIGVEAFDVAANGA